MADGTIVFDTKIDESGAKDGYKKLVSNYKSQLKSLEKEIKNAQSYSDDIQKSMDKEPSNKDFYQKRLERNADYIQQLKNEWDSLSSQLSDAETKPPEIVPEEQISSLDKLKTKVKEATKNVRSFFSEGKKTENMAKSLTKSIFSLGNMFKMLALRQIMRAALSGVKEGFGNLIQYSESAKDSVYSLKAAASSFSNGMAAAVAPLLNAVAPALSTIINLFTDAANACARFFAMLTGAKTFVVAKKQSADYAKSLDNVASSAKKAEGALAGIDEINDISASSSGGGGGGADYGQMFDTVDTGPMSEVAQKAKALLDQLVQQAHNLKDAFKEAWDYNGNGAAILSDIRGILNDCYDTTMEMAIATTQWTETLNLVPLLSSVRGAFDNILPLVVTINDVISYLYQNALLPIASWVIESGLPAFIDVVSAGLNFINSLLQSMSPVLQTIFENIIQPIASVLGDVIVFALETIANFLNAIAGWMAENQPIMDAIWAVLVAIGVTLGGYFAYQAIIMGIFDAFNAVSKAGELFSGVLSFICDNPILVFIAAVIAIIILLATHWEEVKQVAKDVWDSIKSTYEGSPAWFKNICGMIGNAFSFLTGLVKGLITGDWSQALDSAKGFFQNFDNFLTGIFTYDFSKNFGVLGGVLNGFFKTVNDVWGNIKQIFNGIITFITGVFSGNWAQAWEGIKQVFSGIIGGIANIFKTPINMIIGGINTFIRGINRIKIPNWVPGVGGLGFNISTIPMLATGTVVPPNAGEFMAVLGDNKRETEVVSPLSTMKKAVAEVLAENGYSSDSETVQLLKELIVVVQSKKLLVSDVGKAAADYANSEYKRTGEPIFDGV